ncbi:MAG: YqeG family HAD IIIA-type phosphatase [Oscillospiraceae bacterium]|nr:YqeG family HAD IIIA-type phosphatase [Oscillospiraceae bacterium]
MHTLFKGYMPDYIFEKTTNITPQFLAQRGIKCLFLDADGTLRRHKSPVAAEGVMEWIDLMHKNGVKLIITSNNFKKYVKPFADTVKLPYICFSAKPTPVGFWRARFRTGVPLKNTMVIGDQLFTDAMGAHVAGMQVAMVLPVFDEKGVGFDMKRNFEQKYIDRYLKEKGEFL